MNQIVKIKFLNYSNFIFLLFFVFDCLSSNRKIEGKVIICTVGKNIAKAFSASSKNLEKIGELFDDYRIFIYENNSTDNSKGLLKNWARLNSRVIATCEQLSLGTLLDISPARTWDNQPFRTCVIAMARNKVLQMAMAPCFDDFTYIIMADFDLDGLWNYRAFLDIFNFEKPWDAICANGVYGNEGYMYDHFAFRSFEKPFGPELLGESWWLVPKNVRLPAKSFIPVIAACGGLYICKRNAIKNCWFSGVVNDEMEIFYKNFIHKNKNAVAVKAYYDGLKQCNRICLLDVQKKFDYNTGIRLTVNQGALIWRLHAGCQNYPISCDNVPFFMAMANRGFHEIYVYSELKPVWAPS